MSKRRHKNTQKGTSPKPAQSGTGNVVRPPSAATPDAHDLDDMSAALARAMETAPEPESMDPDAHDDNVDTDAFAASEANAIAEVEAAEVVASDVDEHAISEPEAHAEVVEKAERKKLKLHKHGKGATEAEAPHEETEATPEAEPVPAPVRGPHESAFAKLADYERLSLEHVPGLPEQADEAGHWRGVGFGLGQRRLVTAFDEVVEIMPLPQITHVPGTQPWMLGVANVRGTLLPVVDLKQFLEGERTVIHEGQRVLVVRQTGGNVAVLIDALYGQRSFNDAQMITADDEEGRYGYFIKQVYRVSDNDWGVFSMSMLTRTPEFRQAAA
jgi:twitching motility protein PilI